MVICRNQNNKKWLFVGIKITKNGDLSESK